MELNSCDGLGWRLLRLKRPALDEGVDEFINGELFALRGANNLIRQLFIRESEGTAQSVFDQVFGESAGEVYFSVGDDVAEFVIIGERRAVVKGAGGIDRPGLSFLPFSSGMVRGAPLAGGVEIFQSEADGVDLAMATGALGFCLMGQ